MNYAEVIAPLLTGEVIKATKYLSPNKILRAVRTRYHGKFTRKGENVEISLTIGRPNYMERDLIKWFLKAKEPFPVKKVQLKLYNPPKKELKRVRHARNTN